MLRDDIQAAKSANHPPVKLDATKKKKRAKPAVGPATAAGPPEVITLERSPPSASDINTSEPTKRKRQRKGGKGTTTPDVNEASKADPDYVDDSGEVEAVLDDSDEDTPRQVKKAKKKDELRQQIHQKRQDPPTADIVIPSSQPPSKKAKYLVEGFRNVNPKNGIAEPAMKVTSAIEGHSDDLAKHAEGTDNNREEAKYDAGGFGEDDEDDADEKDMIAKSTNKPLPLRKQQAVATIVSAPVIVKVEATTSVPEFVSPDKSKTTVVLGDFPSNVRKAFSDYFAPALLEFVGCIKAWTSPESGEMANLWMSCTPDDVHQGWEKLNGPHALLEALANDKITSWRNKFGTTAITVLEEIFRREGVVTAETRQAYVERQLEGDQKTKNFYFLHTAVVDGKTERAGPFQSEIIARTFAEHLKATKSISDEDRIPDKPVGALVLSILAVQRALTLYSTGEKVMRGAQSHFSQKVWGDKVVNIEGQSKKYKTTSSVHDLFGFNKVKNCPRVSDVQWERILTTAQTHTSKRVSEKTSVVPLITTPQANDVDEDWEMPDEDPEQFLARIKMREAAGKEDSSRQVEEAGGDEAGDDDDDEGNDDDDDDDDDGNDELTESSEKSDEELEDADDAVNGTGNKSEI
ncbi:hypothetical protein D9758_004936 [Tetrapyrgos nigripes]|uniref:DUF6532 domain-containing protein n=1 Tax=Tetrapyrgos nigripes TaxID=182062 RepID=A0A8H5GVR5_9AGAR|nr:hypothetical protein D9758_004936 [Tetrapyrgos nigripes]